jgi:hypothetical protein
MLVVGLSTGIQFLVWPTLTWEILHPDTLQFLQHYPNRNIPPCCTLQVNKIISMISIEIRKDAHTPELIARVSGRRP